MTEQQTIKDLDALIDWFKWFNEILDEKQANMERMQAHN